MFEKSGGAREEKKNPYPGARPSPHCGHEDTEATFCAQMPPERRIGLANGVRGEGQCQKQSLKELPFVQKT